MTSDWDGHYCEENFREVVFEIAIIIAISLIGQKKFEICIGFDLFEIQRDRPLPAGRGQYLISTI